MADAQNAVDMAAAWLALQCQSIDGAVRGIVLLAGKTPNSFDSAASWPEGAASHSPALKQAASLALRELRGVTNEDPSTRGKDHVAAAHVAYPIVVDDVAKGVVAVSLRDCQPESIRSALRQLQWGVAWMRERILLARADEQERLLDRSRAALDLLGESLGYRGFDASAMAAVTSLAARTQCIRVSLGIRSGRTIKVRAISNSAQFGRKMSLVAALEAAMDEAVDQRSIIVYPATTEQIAATTAHAELSRVTEECHILTIPLLVADDFIGAMTFERFRDMPFEDSTVELLELTTAVIGPVLEEKRLNDRWIFAKIGESVELQLARAFGPGHLLRKLILAAIVGAAVFLSLATGVYRVEADAQVEGSLRRAVVAPYDGFLADSTPRAGDLVAEGDLLATLEDSDLLLERLKAVTERDQRSHEYDKALAARQPAAINVIQSQIRQAEAQIKLIDEQLSRIKLRSPIAGLVVSGDLSQLIGTSVQRGQVLFEVAPLNSYRVILDVDEREIGQIETGQKGQLVVTALPNENLPFFVSKMTPIAEARAGKNVFRVEGEVEGDTSRLRPGMEGVAKIDIGQRKLAWIWMHPLTNWARVWFWRWTR
ncbi:HlyD family efflux transporter periplasmic adaptor subunit [uncultured Rhodoblastus sp.]|uniref:efflux RND transporter periplasmic adaptor subunit n=1 Tax=uncultured Rhodoblastus sp. TaxID=543037 RepID=UPI0025CF11EF|nr:HlyD family efflux transporter periplasmic adaptor subunit [uncultured Rhodoblastus sp.]